MVEISKVPYDRKDVGIRKFQYVAKTQFLYFLYHLELSIESPSASKPECLLERKYYESNGFTFSLTLSFFPHLFSYLRGFLDSMY